MKTDQAKERETIAWLLVQEGYNATELAEALEVSRQSALQIIRTIDRNRLRKSLSPGFAASTWMAAEWQTLPAWRARG